MSLIWVAVMALAMAAAAITAGTNGEAQTSASAQTTSGQKGGNASQVLRPAGDQAGSITYHGVSADRMRSATILDDKGQYAGTVGQVLVGPRNQVTAVTTIINGVSGMSGGSVVIPMQKLQYDPGRGNFTAGLSRNEIESLPKWQGHGEIGSGGSDTGTGSRR